MGAVSDPLKIDHAPRQRKSKRNPPRLDQSSDIYTERSTAGKPSPRRGEGYTSRSVSIDDDADGDVSNADAAEPDDESDEDGEGDEFAPSDRAMEKRGYQAGHSNGELSDRESTFDRKQGHGSNPCKDKTKITKARLTAGDSDDDVYNRVDLISDSEEDEPKVEEMEERNIIESEEAADINAAPTCFEASDGWEGFELDDGLFLEDVPFFDEQYGRTDSNVLDSELGLFQSASIFDEMPSPLPPSPSHHRVRFKEPRSQLSNDSDMDSDNRDINVLFGPATIPVVGPGGDLDLGGPYLDHEGDDGSSVGSSSGYESGLHDLILSVKLTFLLFS